jgi:hypothetical protein
MYEKLKKIQTLIWRDDDLMSQDTLFELQEEFTNLLLEVAQKENKTKDLVTSFSWLYKTE